jgi:hypothetical protein
MATKNVFFRHGTFSINNGAQIRFWEDAWLDNAPLSEQYPTLYRIARRQGDTIATVMATSPPECDVQAGFTWTKTCGMEYPNSPARRYSFIA